MIDKTFIFICLKDFFRNKKKLSKIFFTFFLSLFVFSSVLVLESSIKQELNKSSVMLLGGDFEITSGKNPIQKVILEKIKKNFQISEIIEFNTIIRNESESLPIRVKAFDENYPLVGELKITPEKVMKNNENNIYVNKNTGFILDLKINQKVKIQDTFFVVSGFIEDLPDLNNFFSYGDFALIQKKSMNSLDLNNLGSFLQHKYKVVKNQKNDQSLKNLLKEEKNLKIRSSNDLNEQLSKNSNNFIFFLSIVSICSLLISGIGLYNSLLSFINSNRLQISIYKSLGISKFRVKVLMIFQIILMLVFSSLFSYLLSILTVNNLNKIFDTDLFSSKYKFSFFQYFAILSLSLIILMTFLFPITKLLDKFNISDLLKKNRQNLEFSFDKHSILICSFFLTIFISITSIISSKTYETFLIFIFFIICLVLFFYFSKFQNYLIYFLNTNNITLRIIKKNIKNFSNFNSIISISMGVGFSIVFFIFISSSSINSQINKSMLNFAPDYFFVGIQKEDYKKFKYAINELDENAKNKIVKISSARVTKINDLAVEKIISKQNDSFWFINGERRISWQEKIPENNYLTKGKWWDKESKNLQLSIDDKVAHNFKLNLGDKLTLNIAGRNVVGEIINFRKVDYTDMTINFAILINPQYGNKIPFEHLASIKFSENKKINLKGLIDSFPNITYFDLRIIVKKTNDFLNKVFLGGGLISSFVIFIGLLVVCSSFKLIESFKNYQNMIFKILGLKPKHIIRILLIEVFLISIPIIVSSLLLSTVVSYVFINYIIGFEWHYPATTILLISLTFLISLTTVIFISNFKNLTKNTYSQLRRL